MLKVKNILQILSRRAPLELSQIQIEQGAYDNSGIIVDLGDDIQKILFTLDLSKNAIEKAISLGAKLIVTHHPAIYSPIKSIDIDKENKDIALALKNGISVISMHLNLDVANVGIDQNLALALGAKKMKILQPLTKHEGYGREFDVEKIDLLDYVSKISKTLNTDKIIVYGNGNVQTVASFCGAGASHAIDLVKSDKLIADTVVTSDMAHHQIKELIENGKKVILIPHYVAENYGFKKFYEWAKSELVGDVSAYYFEDITFM